MKAIYLMLTTVIAMSGVSGYAGTVTLYDANNTQNGYSCAYEDLHVYGDGTASVALTALTCLGSTPGTVDPGTGGTVDPGTGGTGSGTASGVVDTGYYDQNLSYTRASNLPYVNHPTENTKVYIVDQGDGSTYPPSCINGLSASECSSRNLWNTGANTNQIWSFRLRSSAAYNYTFVSPRPLVVAPSSIYTGGKFDYVLSSKPGEMTTDFTVRGAGTCELRNTNNASMLVIAPEYTRATGGCEVPRGTELYLNVKVVTSLCDNTGMLCNGAFSVGDGFR